MGALFLVLIVAQSQDDVVEDKPELMTVPWVVDNGERYDSLTDWRASEARRRRWLRNLWGYLCAHRTELKNGSVNMPGYEKFVREQGLSKSDLTLGLWRLAMTYYATCGLVRKFEGQGGITKILVGYSEGLEILRRCQNLESNGNRIVPVPRFVPPILNLRYTAGIAKRPE